MKDLENRREEERIALERMKVCSLTSIIAYSNHKKTMTSRQFEKVNFKQKSNSKYIHLKKVSIYDSNKT